MNAFAQIFQVDHPVVQAAYDQDNCKIVIDEAQRKETCVIYFSSNDIYFPNTEWAFQERIVKKDHYEWYKTRVQGAYKHIFLRDVRKQWYLTGINSRLCTPDALQLFLEVETNGFKIVTIGSSAGGYAAVLYGVLLGAVKVLCFNAQFELNGRLLHSTECVDPIVFRLSESDCRIYYDLRNIIGGARNIYYFYSMLSDQDCQQRAHIQNCAVNVIGFKTAHHGIPFLKCALDRVLGFNGLELINLARREHHPVMFSIYYCGVFRVVRFCFGLIVKVSKNYFTRFFRAYK